jgi:hypothetical protein
MKKSLVLLVILLLGFFVFSFPRKNAFLPDEMVGTWQSDDVRYEGRLFRLTKTTVIFGMGENQIDVYFIADTKIISQGPDEVVQLSLHHPGEADINLSLIYRNKDEETLCLLNQQNVIWNRVSEDNLALF